jgi:hypothetical protein
MILPVISASFACMAALFRSRASLHLEHLAARVTRSFTPVRMEADLIPRPKLFAAHTVIPSGMTASVEYVT